MVKAMAICTRHPFLHIYKVEQPYFIDPDMSHKLTWSEATFTISSRGVFQIAISGNIRIVIRCSQLNGLIINATTLDA